ncbi:MAG: 4Fe-4S binding protein [Acidobacteriota bacterium]|nr:4Fe-4S binding protein [Acidobacteriota bacterium]
MSAGAHTSDVAVLVCGDLEPAGELAAADGRLGHGVELRVIAQLCDRPEAAAAALRELSVKRVVLGLCRHRPSRELLGALRRAGAEPFAIETVILGGHRAEAAALLDGAAARLQGLQPGERGRPALGSGDISRRALFAPRAMLDYAPVAIVEPHACIGSRGCGLCAIACPVAAVDVSNERPLIDTSSCTACAACVTVCPSGAIRLSGCSREQVEAQLEALLGRVVGIVFACSSADAEAPAGWALVELPTLALLTPAWILQARLRGAEVRLAPCGEACCADSGAVMELSERIAGDARGCVGEQSTRPQLAEPAGTVEAVLALVPDCEPRRIEHRASPLGLLELDRDSCTLCGACTIACPSDALALRQDAAEMALTLEPSACVGCDRCTAVCPEDALSVRRGVDSERLRAGQSVLMQAKRDHCMVCATELPPLSMRRRLRELLPELSETPGGLCVTCATRAVRQPAAAAPKSDRAWWSG